MEDSWLTIELLADRGAGFTVMFEPSGMTYRLEEGERMTAQLVTKNTGQMQIVNWDGGVTVWCPGSVVTWDSKGNELHRLN